MSLRSKSRRGVDIVNIAGIFVSFVFAGMVVFGLF
jgi:hypothetical protein